MAYVYVIDTETTGLDPEKDKVVDIAAVCVSNPIDGIWRVQDRWSSFVNPGIPIPPEASAVHHILDDDVVDAPPLSEAIQLVLGTEYEGRRIDIVAAHNAKFDHGFLPTLHDRKWICTWRCAKHVWPDAPAYGNQVLRYWLKLDVPRALPTHRALGDAIVTAHLLVRLLEERSLDELVTLSTKAVLLKKVGFGKHFGQLWTDVPTDYLRWASGVGDLDPDVKFTVKSELARRGSFG